MREHFKTLSAVFPLIMREQDGIIQILLHKRLNTGYQDGKWDCAGSGHVDEGETMKMAVVREMFEELGIKVNIEDIEFAHLAHNLGTGNKNTYYNGYFVIRKYTGDIMIKEPNKCSELQWFDIRNLPEDIIFNRKLAIENFLSKNAYSENIKENK